MSPFCCCNYRSAREVGSTSFSATSLTPLLTYKKTTWCFLKLRKIYFQWMLIFVNFDVSKHDGGIFQSMEVAFEFVGRGL